MVILHWEDNFQPLFKCIVNAFLSNEGFETILIFFLELFHDRGRYHVENSPLIYQEVSRDKKCYFSFTFAQIC